MHGLIQTVADIYRLKLNQVCNLVRFAKKSATALIQAINHSKVTTLSRLIYALGIRHVGLATAKDLAAAFGSLEQLQQATMEQLLQINDIGQITANSIYNFFAEPHNQQVIHQLLELGVSYLQVSTKRFYHPQISGKRFVISGKFIEYNRDEIKAILEKFNAQVTSSVSKKTDYLIVGSQPGTKLDKARQFGVKLLNAEELKKLLKELI